jgi:tetratricopeptide (TPR) repeat protein
MMDRHSLTRPAPRHAALCPIVLATGLLLLVAASLTSAQTPRNAQPRLPSKDLQQAAGLIERRQFDRAMVLINGVLKTSPQNTQALNLLGLALTATGKLEQANAQFEKAIKSDPKFYPALKNQALNELSLGQVEEAQRHLEQVLTLAPDDAGANLSVAEIYFHQKQYKGATEHYLKTQGLFLRSTRTILDFAQSCFDSDQAALAAGALESLPADADAKAHFQAGLMLAQIERYDSAAQQFDLARKDYPDPYEVGFNLTLANVRARKYPQAIQTAQDLISRGYRKAELYNLLSEALEANGQTIQAYDALRTATRIDPQDENNYLDLIALGVDHANFDLALDIANIGLHNIPGSFRLTMQRGAALAFRGQIREAQADFETAAKLDPNSNLPYFALCMALMQTDQAAKALELLRQRLARSPDDYLLLYALGESLDRARAAGSVSEDEAVRALERSVELNPSLTPARMLLGKFYLRRDDVDRAIAELEKALELDPTDLTPCYQLSQAYRRKGDQKRADELLAKFQQFRDEDREKHINRNLLKLLREGEQ